MNILQVEFKNRSGHTLRGVVTLPDVEGPVPFVVHLHGFGGSCSGYKSMYTHMSRALASKELVVYDLAFMEMAKVMANLKI